mgnify:CR=1 FL=1
MTRDELIKTAIKTVIQYAEEQGVKLRRIDFKESKWIFVPDGAINYYTLPFGKDEISIHAPAKGATLCFHELPLADQHFNPRSREGSDSNIIQQISFSLYNTVYFVSNNIK